MTHARCCCQDPALPCDALASGVCFTLDFAGIQINPCTYDSGDGYPIKVVALTGINRRFRMHSDANFEPPSQAAIEFEALLVLDYDGAAPPGYVGPRPFEQSRFFWAVVGYTCVENRVAIDRVAITAFDISGGQSDVFDWVGQAFPGETLPNQIECPQRPGVGYMEFGIGGQVTVSAVQASAGNCVVDAPAGVIAELCSDPTVRISVDASLAPSGHYGIEHEGQNYRLTTLSTDDPPIAVTWVEEVCPPKGGGDLFEAIRCRNTGLATEGPPKVAYEPSAGIPAGDGIVRFQVYRTFDAFGGGCRTVTCLFNIWYQTTTTPADPSLPIGTHMAGNDCSNPDTGQCIRSGCNPGVEPDPVDPCNLPPDQRPDWCPNVELMGGGGGEEGGGGELPEGLMAMQTIHLAEPLARQRRASNCRGCGD